MINPIEKGEQKEGVRRGAVLRAKVLQAAVASLIEVGVARTTTLEVQRRAGVSRGALLHHFPTHAQLLSATIEALVAQNDEVIEGATDALDTISNPIERAIRALAYMSRQPAFMAEMELWASARTDPDLRLAILEAERKARSERERVIAMLFATVAEHPNFAALIRLSIGFLRGMALTHALVTQPEYFEQVTVDWCWAVQSLLDQD